MHTARLSGHWTCLLALWALWSSTALSLWAQYSCEWSIQQPIMCCSLFLHSLHFCAPPPPAHRFPVWLGLQPPILTPTCSLQAWPLTSHNLSESSCGKPILALFRYPSSPTKSCLWFSTTSIIQLRKPSELIPGSADSLPSPFEGSWGLYQWFSLLTALTFYKVSANWTGE